MCEKVGILNGPFPEQYCTGWGCYPYAPLYANANFLILTKRNHKKVTA